MKKIFLSLTLVLLFIAGHSQSIVQRSTGANTLNDPNLFTSKSFRPPVAADTVGLNNIVSLDSCGKIAFTYDVMALWVRACSPKRWERVGGVGSFENSSSVIFSGTGASTNPIVANVNISQQQGNVIQSTGQGLFVPNFVQDGIIEPGVITWIQNYDYDVSPAIGVIGGVEYTSTWTPITLATSDPTFDRIDLVVFNAGVGSSVGTITVITGTPAADPQQPTVTDPSTQLAMAFILVTANTTAPPTPPSQDWIYENYITNAWTTLSSSVRINDQSTTFPYSVPTDVQGMAAQNGDNIRFTSISPPDISDFNVITLKIRSQSIWTGDSKIELRWYSGATPIGNVFSIAYGTYGFNPTTLFIYQIVTIPLSNFGALANVTNLLMTVRTTGNRTISFLIDDIQLQQGIVPSVSYTASNAITLVGSDFQWGGALTKNTNVTSAGFNTNFTGFTTVGNLVNITQNSAGTMALSATASSDAILGQSATGAGVIARSNNTLVSSVENSLKVQRTGVTIPTVGYGAAQEFMLNAAGGSASTALRSNRLISSWSDEGIATRTAQFTLTGVLNAVESDLLTVAGSGATKLNKYVTNAFLGTPTNAIGTDASGNLVQFAVPTSGISAITGDNGVNASSPTNIQLGGSLIQNTIITTAANTFSMTGTSTGTNAIISVTQSGSTQFGINATSQSGSAFRAFTSGGAAFEGQINDAGTTTVLDGVIIRRNTSGTAANGLGTQIRYSIESTDGSAYVSNYLTSKWTDATLASRTSQFIIQGVNSAVTGNILTLEGNGAMTLGAAYQGLGAGYLAVSNTGQVTWSAGGGGGGGDALTANPLSQFTATTSAQLAGVISNETGTNLLVYSDGATLNSPTLVTPALGTPASGTLTNATGLPVSTGISGLGTGVATALAVNTGSTGAFVLFNGALGTPTSGTVSTGVTLGDVTMNVTGTDATGDMYYRDAAGVLTRIPIGTNGQVLRVSAGGLPEYFTTAGSGTVTSVATSQPAAGFTITGGPITGAGTFTFALANDLAAVEGLATTGIVRRTGTDTWSAGTAVSLTTEITGTLPVGNGGTGLTSVTTSTILIGTGSNTWAQATPTATNGATVTMGSGTMVISTVFNPTVQTLIDGATITWNVTNGGNAVVTLAGTGRILSITNPIAGYTYTIRVVQGSGGSKTITTWPTNTRWPNGTPIVLSTTAGDYDVIVLYFDGSQYLASYQLDYSYIDIFKIKKIVPMYNDGEDYKIAA